MKLTDSISILGHKRFFLVTAVLFAAQAFAQESSTRAQRQVLVSVPDRKLAVIENGEVLRVFAVAVGADVSPSPSGQFLVINRVTNPTYYHAGQVIPAGKGNPVGTRWVGLNRKGYGIHGTNVPSSVGHAASHGCIRLRNRDMEQLFEMLRTGDTVEIRAEPDEETAEIFGDAEGFQQTALAQATTAVVAGGGQ
jgi:lipoprotein-anchoring transpeptidase ErfK/SrfK